jgi:hypothetical protein
MLKAMMAFTPRERVTAEQTVTTEITLVAPRRSSNLKTGLRSFINIGSKIYNFSTLALSCPTVIVDLLSFKMKAWPSIRIKPPWRGTEYIAVF